MTYRPHRWLAIAVIAGLLTCPLYALDDADVAGLDLVEIVWSWIEDAVDDLIGPVFVLGGQSQEAEGSEVGASIEPVGFEEPPTDEFGGVIEPTG